MVTVFGLGFVGLTTALGFANKGFKVFGIDVNKERSAQIAKGDLPFFEPHMDKALSENLNKNFFVIDDVKIAMKESKYIFYCVGTPYGENGAADLSYLFKAIDTSVKSIDDDTFRIMIVKSTVPPSTTLERVLPHIKECKANIGLANNPEFLREGYCWDDFINADRIVLGCADSKSEQMLRELYAPFNAPIVVVSYNTAEFIKYLSNTLLATMISYSNEMAFIADSIGNIDVKNAFKTLHMDKRWGGCNMTSYVYPGCGYGGYCLPKDTKALLSQSMQKGYSPEILRHVIVTNDSMPNKIADKIIKNVNKDESIGILGLSFKPNSDDVRDTPAAKIIKELINRGYCNIVAHDPIAIQEFKKHYDFDIKYCDSLDDIHADVMVITTAWKDYAHLKGKIIDCRYCLD